VRRIRLHEPSSIEEAGELLEHYGEASQAFAGGTELLLLMKLGVVHFEHLVNLKRIAALKGITYDEASGWLRIGAATTHRELELSPTIREHLPALAEAERQVANVRVRNTGTLGGNLCFADPHSDPATLLLVLGAELVLQRGKEQRVVSIGEFFTDAYDTVRQRDELLVEVRIPPLKESTAVAYERFCYYERPTANIALALDLDDDGASLTDVRLAVGSVVPVPVRMANVETRMVGLAADAAGRGLDEILEGAVEELEILEDLLGATDYKRNLIQVLSRRALARAVDRLPTDSRLG
jgi:aerobic carbon-monoxide dehydrogenase medium subunit